jgi:prepilin-type N-terminal cleavage/methylation domain-containing protein
MNIAPSVHDARRGFTLIELLVVIAIIGILSSVVLASLNTARSKGTDAKIQSEIRSIQVNAEIYYDNNGNTYGTAQSGCALTAGTLWGSATNPNITQIINDLQAVHPTYNLACNSSATAYAIQHQLTSPTATTYFCADSTGKVGTSSTALVALTACP